MMMMIFAYRHCKFNECSCSRKTPLHSTSGQFLKVNSIGHLIMTERSKIKKKIFKVTLGQHYWHHPINHIRFSICVPSSSI